MGVKNGRGTVQRFMCWIVGLPAFLAIFALKGYKRWFSPWLPTACRFYPTCSVYAVEVISAFGFIRGGYLSLKRVLKCQPFHSGGIDLPPKR